MIFIDAIKFVLAVSSKLLIVNPGVEPDQLDNYNSRKHHALKSDDNKKMFYFQRLHKNMDHSVVAIKQCPQNSNFGTVEVHLGDKKSSQSKEDAERSAG